MSYKVFVQTVHGLDNLHWKPSPQFTKQHLQASEKVLPIPCVLLCPCCCSMTAFDRDNLQLIFGALVDWWLRKFSYSQNIAKLAKGLVSAT